MTAWKVVGLGLGIVVDGQVVYQKGHGLRDLEKKLPATPKTMFAIGSSSKASPSSRSAPWWTRAGSNGTSR